MTDNQMRAEFEAFIKQYYVKHGFISSLDELHTTWQVAYRAGMERAAKVCHDIAMTDPSDCAVVADACAAAIREEMK